MDLAEAPGAVDSCHTMSDARERAPAKAGLDWTALTSALDKQCRVVDNVAQTFTYITT